MKYKVRNVKRINENIVNAEVELRENEYVDCTVDMNNPGDLRDLRDQLLTMNIYDSHNFEEKSKNYKLKNLIVNYNNKEIPGDLDSLTIYNSYLSLNFENSIKIKCFDKSEIEITHSELKTIVKLILEKINIIKNSL